GAARRESSATPVTSTSARPVARPPVSSAIAPMLIRSTAGSPSRPEALELLAGNDPIVERHDAVGDALPRLVALAGNHHDVAGRRATDGHADRFATIHFHLVGASGLASARFDLGDDRERVLRWRVVGGE